MFFRRRRYPSTGFGSFGTFFASPWARIGMSVLGGLFARRAYSRRARY